MNIVDFILGFGLIWLTWKGWQSGLVQNLLGLLSMVVAYVAALAYGESVTQQLFDTAQQPNSSVALVGFLIVFFLVLLACYVLGKILHKTLQASPLGIVDAVGGGVLGLAKGLLIFGLITIFFRLYPIHSRVPDLIDNSFLGPPVQKAALIIADTVQKIFPKTQNLLDRIGVKSENAPPLVDKLNKGAHEAQRKINDLMDESKKHLENK